MSLIKKADVKNHLSTKSNRVLPFKPGHRPASHLESETTSAQNQASERSSAPRQKPS